MKVYPIGFSTHGPSSRPSDRQLHGGRQRRGHRGVAADRSRNSEQGPDLSKPERRDVTG
jgi:hypothetical protein